MKLRDHPLMTRKSGAKSWPPIWISTYPTASKKLIGEVGTLQQVLLNNLMNNRIFVFVNCRGFRYTGSMQFDDPNFCS
jgi:hypothetical protein